MIQEADRLFRRYMSCLGWLGDPGLFELVRTHVVKVPVENVSAILAQAEGGRAGLPDVEAFLSGIERHDLGGSGLTNNGYFVELLRYLDYDAELLGADVDGRPLAHAVCRVLYDDRPHLVDVGLGAPLYEPIPLDRGLPYRVQSGERTYVLDRHAAEGCYEMVTLERGARVSSYVVRPAPRRLADFAPGVQALHAADGEHLRHLRVTRIFASRRATLRDCEVTIARDGESASRRLPDLAALEAAMQEDFQLPRLPIARAAQALRLRGIDVFAGA